MYKYLIFSFILFFSSNIFSQSLKAEYKAIDSSLNESRVALSNGIVRLELPTDLLKGALIIAVNNDPTVILNKKEKRAFSMSTLGKKEVFEGFVNDISQLNNTVSDIPGILFNVKKQVIKNKADKELTLAIKKLHDALLDTNTNKKSYYSKANDITVYYLFNEEKNIAFIVNKKYTDYFTIIDSDNISPDDFVNYIVKGVLQ
ncbi:MAG TPA: hypothetical protein ENJ28_03730 [Gammaproteobacteria bacterium]|nr:hypothetical protein [Gammaproteobacteria bacterium]